MKKIFLSLFLQAATLQVFSQSIIYQITNCDGENRTLLFANQIDDIMYAAKGDITFKTSRSLKFSPESKVNLDSLDIAAIQFRKAFPKNYWNQNVPTIRLDTKPNEEGGIWFENVFVETNSKKNIKVIATLKVVFAGTNAEKERMNPKIQDIIITTDPIALKKYIAVIQQLKKANNIQSPTAMRENDSAPPPPIRD